MYLLYIIKNGIHLRVFNYIYIYVIFVVFLIWIGTFFILIRRFVVLCKFKIFHKMIFFMFKYLNCFYFYCFFQIFLKNFKKLKFFKILF